MHKHTPISKGRRRSQPKKAIYRIDEEPSQAQFPPMITRRSCHFVIKPSSDALSLLQEKIAEYPHQKDTTEEKRQNQNQSINQYLLKKYVYPNKYWRPKKEQKKEQAQFDIRERSQFFTKKNKEESNLTCIRCNHLIKKHYFFFQTKQCKHVYHMDCAQGWFKTLPQCYCLKTIINSS